MRKSALLSLATAAALTLGLSACGGSGTDDNTNDGSTTDGGTSEDATSDDEAGGEAGGLITIIVNEPANPYWKTEGDVAAAAAEELGYEAVVGAHKGDVNTENTLIDTAISNKSVALILDPANADGSIASVKKANDAGIPVFMINAEINESGLALVQLVSNNAQGAAIGAQYWVEQMGEAGDYVELFGLTTDNNAQTRSNGFTTVISQYPDLVQVGMEVADWDRALGHSKMQSMMQANPDLTGVISGNDEMALGAIAALKEAGKLENVVVGGFDGSPDAVDAVKAGEMAYTVLQPVAVFARQAVEMADTYIRTGEAPATEKQSLDCILITPENVDKMVGAFTYDG